jgi:flagellar hook protein FlgE
MSFQIALSGLNAASTDLQVTSNNIANANTIGFKASRAEFADVFSGDAIGIGNGVRLSEVRQEFTQGNVDITERQLDLAISGKGFFIVNDAGSRLYSRVGAFGLNADGYIENAEAERLQMYEALPGGGFNNGTLVDVRLTTGTAPPVATQTVEANVNLPNTTPPSSPVFDPTDPDSYNHSTSTVAYDSRGVAHTATFYFIANATGWNAAATIDGAPVGALEPFTFDASGRLATPANGLLNFNGFDPANGANVMNIELDMSPSTQYGTDFVVNQINPDGQAQGRLRSIEIDPSGVIFARFSNGQSNALGQIALANFSNPEGLLKVSDTSFQETFSSGIPQIGEAATSDFGVIQSGALESSNVDLTEQLVRMITSQRLFQANAQVISTMDSVTQTIINIR